MHVRRSSRSTKGFGTAVRRKSEKEARCDGEIRFKVPEFDRKPYRDPT